MEINGFVGNEPEIRQTQKGIKVATYSVAVAREYKTENQFTDWFNVVAWGEQADLVESNIHKGTPVIVLGRFQTRSYDNKEGKKVTVYEFMQSKIGIELRKEKKDAVHESGSIHPDIELPF